MPLSVLNETRLTIGEAQWASQYQQRPAPAGGGMVKEIWFRRFSPSDVPEHWDSVFQSWDTANTMAEWSAYSVCTTWGVRGKSVYLLDVYRARLLYPDLKTKVVELAARFGASRIIIEDNASGTPLIQDLRRDNQRGIEAFKPDGDKEMRMAAQAAIGGTASAIESGGDPKATAVGAVADPADWRVAKSIFVADDEATAKRYGHGPQGPYYFYFKQLTRKLVGFGGRANLFKLDQSEPDERITPEYVTEKLVIAGTVDNVVDQILEFREQTGDFGTLLYPCHDWVDPSLGQRSMQLMAEEVMPRVNRALGDSARARGMTDAAQRRS
jgi:hypothetical protein